MSEDVYVVGAWMSRFAKFYDRNLKSLVTEAAEGALKQAGVTRDDLNAAWVGNAAQGLLTGQETIRGQVALRPAGIDGIPIFNVENACASASTAFHGAWMGIKAGLYDCVLAVGMEKMAFEDPEQKRKAMEVFNSAIDVETLDQVKANQKRQEEQLSASGQASAYGEGRQKSMFMDFYGASARRHMETHGTTQLQLAIISSKNHFHASLNPFAQYRKPMSPEEIISDDVVSFPLTRPMCAPLGDGAAAAVLCSESFLKKLGAGQAGEGACFGSHFRQRAALQRAQFRPGHDPQGIRDGRSGPHGHPPGRSARRDRIRRARAD